jgi:propanol-preferring alcohol dehydrogenase
MRERMSSTANCREFRCPPVPGHEIVGYVEQIGPGVTGLELGQRVGIPWLGHTCRQCGYCLSGHENLCDRPLFTGYTRDGGYAAHAVAAARYASPWPTDDPISHSRTFHCAGLIGWRSLRMAGAAKCLGLCGFGAAAHIVAQVAKWQGRRVFAFTRNDDVEAQAFALRLGAEWAGASDQAPGCRNHLCAGRCACSTGPEDGTQGRVCRLCRVTYERYPELPLQIALGRASGRFRSQSDARRRRQPPPGCRSCYRDDGSPYPLAEANRALSDLRSGRLRGAAVLDMRE